MGLGCFASVGLTVLTDWEWQHCRLKLSLQELGAVIPYNYSALQHAWLSALSGGPRYARTAAEGGVALYFSAHGCNASMIPG